MTGLLVEGTSFIIRWLLTWVMYMFARTTEEGSRTLVHAALDGSNKDIQGKYLNSCHIDEESDLVISKEGKVLQDRIWVSGVVLGVACLLNLGSTRTRRWKFCIKCIHNSRMSFLNSSVDGFMTLH